MSSIMTMAMMAMTTKTPTIPWTRMRRLSKNSGTFILVPPVGLVGDQVDDHAAGDDAGDLAADIDAGRLHQQVVGVVFLEGHLTDNTAAHREGGDAAGADHRVDLLALGQEDIEDFRKDDAAEGVENESKQAQRQDQEGLGV